MAVTLQCRDVYGFDAVRWLLQVKVALKRLDVARNTLSPHLALEAPLLEDLLRVGCGHAHRIRFVTALWGHQAYALTPFTQPVGDAGLIF